MCIVTSSSTMATVLQSDNLKDFFRKSPQEGEQRASTVVIRLDLNHRQANALTEHLPSCHKPRMKWNSRCEGIFQDSHVLRDDTCTESLTKDGVPFSIGTNSLSSGTDTYFEDIPPTSEFDPANDTNRRFFSARRSRAPIPAKNQPCNTTDAPKKAKRRRFRFRRGQLVTRWLDQQYASLRNKSVLILLLLELQIIMTKYNWGRLGKKKLQLSRTRKNRRGRKWFLTLLLGVSDHMRNLTVGRPIAVFLSLMFVATLQLHMAALALFFARYVTAILPRFQLLRPNARTRPRNQLTQREGVSNESMELKQIAKVPLGDLASLLHYKPTNAVIIRGDEGSYLDLRQVFRKQRRLKARVSRSRLGSFARTSRTNPSTRSSIFLVRRRHDQADARS